MANAPKKGVKGLDNSTKQYPLGNKAKDLLIYSFKVTKPTGERRLSVDETLESYKKLADMQTIEERQKAVEIATANMKRNKRQGFPKSAVHTYIATIRNIAVNILRNVHSANNCDGRTELDRRIHTLNIIIDDCSLLLVLIEISHDLEYISASRMENWTKLVCDVKFITMSWKKKEIARLNAAK